MVRFRYRQLIEGLQCKNRWKIGSGGVRFGGIKVLDDCVQLWRKLTRRIW